MLTSALLILGAVAHFTSAQPAEVTTPSSALRPNVTLSEFLATAAGAHATCHPTAAAGAFPKGASCDVPGVQVIDGIPLSETVVQFYGPSVSVQLLGSVAGQSAAKTLATAEATVLTAGAGWKRSPEYDDADGHVEFVSGTGAERKLIRLDGLRSRGIRITWINWGNIEKVMERSQR